MCLPTGLDCYKSLKLTFEKCIIPCKGMYANVVRKDAAVDLETEKQFSTIFNKYKEYKSGVTNNTNEG